MGGRLVWAVCGVAAAAVAIGVGEIVAGLLGSGSIISAVGALVISLQPPGGKDLMVTLFGENDKLALVLGTVIGGLLVGALLGLVARRDRTLAITGFLLFGVAGFVLLQGDPLNGLIESGVTSIAAVLAGAGTLLWLSGALVPSSTGTPDRDLSPGAADGSPRFSRPVGHVHCRRRSAGCRGPLHRRQGAGGSRRARRGHSGACRHGSGDRRTYPNRRSQLQLLPDRHPTGRAARR